MNISCTLTLSKSLENNILAFKNIFPDDRMLVIRRLENKYLSAAKCCVIYFQEMVDNELINENIIQPILGNNLSEGISCDNLLQDIQDKVIAVNGVIMSEDINIILDSLISGDTIFLLEGYEKVLIIASRGYGGRAITEPDSSRSVRGPRAGFTESINVNISLIRRIIRTPDLKLKFKELGERTHTRVCICYIEGVALEGILKEVEKRLDQIQLDGILDSGYIQELIRDAPFSPFETVGYSEKPDAVAGKLLEGRIAILVDGSPFALTAPFIIAEVAQISEDYYNNYIFASINRFIRITAAIFSVSIPSLYLAVVTFHQEMLPTPLLLSISAGRQGVPFPTVLSLIVMLALFDLLREASVRMPASVSEAINIVGTLVIGQALVEAKLVSPIIIIITALTGILSLLNISMVGAAMVLRTLLIISTSILGIYGFLLGLILTLIHLMSIRSFGVPYMLNLSTVKNHDFQDVWIRVPWWEMTLRPKIMGAKNLIRQPIRKNKRK
ncbi:spore germination protein [Clostridium sp. CX1]|uniref:spore germination protein n=1 Tax=Clostridium sp. CX1 TaxID=2978346 RepID=UPI0021BEC7C3|nr:spore germination protein [Clostridium sp. CX1]MCT8978632.1 spore germination protein [Clostridium sp. CX1]